MHVVRHDTPRDQPVSLIVKMNKRGLDKVCRARIAKYTRSVTGILVTIDHSAKLSHARVARRHVPGYLKLDLPSFEHIQRECIGQAERDGLDDTWCIEVR